MYAFCCCCCCCFVVYLCSFIGQYHKLKERYYPQRIVAQDLGIPVQILGRLTSSFKCERGSPDKYVGH